ncbi:MAG: flagellar export protein FliJ [Candidatus Manganitrophus sp. SA1]|nr:flagellar export protein FliJ [Candidatus Manganitrophus morganii]
MPRYQPKLDAVLRQRKRREEEVQEEFIGLKHDLDTAQDQLHRLHRELESALKDLAEQQVKGIAPGELDLYYRLIKHQHDRLEERRKALQHLADRCEKKREDLLEATREKKVVEKIEEKRKDLYLKELEKKERNLLDELAGQPKRESP